MYARNFKWLAEDAGHEQVGSERIDHFEDGLGEKREKGRMRKVGGNEKTSGRS